MPVPTADISRYRPAAGVVIFNLKGQVWYGRRKGEKGQYQWQFPQGGIDKGETADEAAMRELWEETGLKPNDVDVISCIDEWLYYDFPPEYAGKKAVKGWSGQKQRWFAVRVKSKNPQFDLKAHMPIEFSEWRWGELKDGPELIVPFKRRVYERLLVEFADYTSGAKHSTSSL